MNQKIKKDDIHYLVKWDIDIWAASPEEAAQKAREIQLNAESFATVFSVQDVEDDNHTTIVDLDA